MRSRRTEPAPRCAPNHVRTRASACRIEAERAASAAKTRARRLTLPDVDSHAAADDDTRASMKAGASSQGTSDVLFANLESAASNPVEPPLPIGSELCFGMNSGATPAPTSGHDGAFRSRDSCRSAAPRRCRSCDRAGARSSAPSSSRLDELRQRGVRAASTTALAGEGRAAGVASSHVVGMDLHMHPDVGVCSIGYDELIAVLLLRQQRGHAVQPAPGLWNGRLPQLSGGRRGDRRSTGGSRPEGKRPALPCRATSGCTDRPRRLLEAGGVSKRAALPQT